MKLTKEFWNDRYVNEDTGWDLGSISNPIKDYVEQLTDKEVKILIPGGGNSYEAEYLFTNGFKNTFVVEISKKAIHNFLKRVPFFPPEQVIYQDFFKLDGSFDLIIEQTFFCAIDKDLRPAYAKKTAELLSPGGKLVGLLFDAPLYDEHPPYGGTLEEYKIYFEPFFHIETMHRCYNSIEPRAGREVWINMVRKF